MIFIKYINKLILLMFLILFSSIAVSSKIETKCGGVSFQVNILKGSYAGDLKYELFYKVNKVKKKLIYEIEPGVGISVVCIKNKNKQDLILFEVFDGANGRSDVDGVYGVFDPNLKQVIILPDEELNGNSNQVSKLIGYSPPILYDDNDSFCCLNERDNQ